MREKDRRALAATERQLEAEDPELARKLSVDSPRVPTGFRITTVSGALLALAALCVVFGEWFAVLQSLALAAAVIWFQSRD